MGFSIRNHPFWGTPYFRKTTIWSKHSQHSNSGRFWLLLLKAPCMLSNLTKVKSFWYGNFKLSQAAQAKQLSAWNRHQGKSKDKIMQTDAKGDSRSAVSIKTEESIELKGCIYLWYSTDTCRDRMQGGGVTCGRVCLSRCYSVGELQREATFREQLNVLNLSMVQLGHRCQLTVDMSVFLPCWSLLQCLWNIWNSAGHVRHPTLPPGTAHLQQPGAPRVAKIIAFLFSILHTVWFRMVQDGSGMYKWKDEPERLVYEDHEEFKEEEGYELMKEDHFLSPVKIVSWFWSLGRDWGSKTQTGLASVSQAVWPFRNSEKEHFEVQLHIWLECLRLWQKLNAEEWEGRCVTIWSAFFAVCLGRGVSPFWTDFIGKTWREGIDSPASHAHHGIGECMDPINDINSEKRRGTGLHFLEVLFQHRACASERQVTLSR